ALQPAPRGVVGYPGTGGAVVEVGRRHAWRERFPALGQGRVKEGAMTWVVSALHRLEVIAVKAELAYVTVRSRQEQPFKVGHRRSDPWRSEIGPDQVASLDARVGLQPDLCP